MKTPNQTIAAYQKLYREYAANNTLNEHIKGLLGKFTGLLKGKKILDVGCAQGRDSCYFNEQGYEVTGIDLTPEFIEMAKKNCPGATFKEMDMCQLDFNPKTFDGLWVCASFLHIPKNKALTTLIGFKSVLKTGGIMHLSVQERNFNELRGNKDMGWGPTFLNYFYRAD